ncbi:hypothetical protein EDB85DRAFT_2156269 [Lactarius pseudohatsudake]|nr:hypothetical protein EDB85DRAFT_2156269 [Lactarius pseudohatsudake]
MEDDDDNDNPYFDAIASLEYSLADDGGNSAPPGNASGLPHDLGLHLVDAPLHEVLSSQTELIRALTAEPPPPKLPTTKPSAPPKAQTPVKAPPKPSAQTPSFASITKSPARPSLVLSPAPNSSPAPAVRKTPSEICAHLNGVLSALLPGSSLSAARWTKNDNLTSAALSTAVAHFIAADPSQPVPISAKENVRWSRLLINNIPTGASSSRGAYSPAECHDTSFAKNPAYRALSLTRLPSWVKRPDSYAAGSSSSLVVCFEDPTGLALRSLLSTGPCLPSGKQVTSARGSRSLVPKLPPPYLTGPLRCLTPLVLLTLCPPSLGFPPVPRPLSLGFSSDPRPSAPYPVPTPLPLLRAMHPGSTSLGFPNP